MDHSVQVVFLLPVPPKAHCCSVIGSHKSFQLISNQDTARAYSPFGHTPRFTQPLSGYPYRTHHSESLFVPLAVLLDEQG